MGGEWEHGLCGCFDNCGICIIAFFAPCYIFGKNAEAVGDSCCLCGICSFIPIANMVLGASTRGKIRDRQTIDGSFIGDLVLWCFCPFCAMVQEHQEIGHMGGMSMDRQ